MKKLILTILVASSSFALAGSAFDRGFALGWKEGYKQIAGQYVFPPFAPFPPFPEFGQDTFFGGYNEGFLEGMAEAQGE